MLSNLKHAAVPSALFLVLSLPQLYGKTGGLFGGEDNCPNVKTRLLHTLAFFALTYLVAKYHDTSASRDHLVRYSLHSALAFFALSSPELYALTDNILGRVNGDLAQQMGSFGCPSMVGVGIHTVLFALFLTWAKSLK